MKPLLVLNLTLNHGNTEIHPYTSLSSTHPLSKCDEAVDAKDPRGTEKYRRLDDQVRVSSTS